jgi:hypothetical protein
MQDIVDRIAKLLALASSPNEYEASAAAAKASELLTAHNLRLENFKTSRYWAWILLCPAPGVLDSWALIVEVGGF